MGFKNTIYAGPGDGPYQRPETGIASATSAIKPGNLVFISNKKASNLDIVTQGKNNLAFVALEGGSNVDGKINDELKVGDSLSYAKPRSGEYFNIRISEAGLHYAEELFEPGSDGLLVSLTGDAVGANLFILSEDINASNDIALFRKV